MKIMFGSRIHHYVKRLGIFLITVALVMGLASCDGGCGAPSLLQYDLTISSNEGGQVIISGEGTYADGTVVRLEAVADECYEFVSWTGADVTDPYSPITFVTMDEAKNVTANFALLSYDLTADSTDGGEVTTPSEGTFPHDCGTAVDLVATPAIGYRFVEWTGDIGTIADIDAAETTITMNGDYSITAEFAWQYYLSLNSTGGGSVTEPGEGVFPCDEGSVVDLVAEAEESYHFVQWTGNVSTIADVHAASTTITMNGDYSITANFILFAGGNGTAEDPYQIADWRHLDNVRNYLSSHFIVINDLDSNSIGYTELASETANEGKGWEPIGTLLYPFTGSLNGQGYEICDLFIDRPDESDVGLFGVVEEGGVIENVGVVANGNVTGNANVGGLVGKNEGTVSDSYSTGNVTGNANVGGLVGWNFKGTVIDTYSTGNVTGLDNVGGLVGKNSGTASNSYSTGSVTGDDNVGGLVGKNDNTGTASNSYSTGNVTGNTHVGGLMGRNQGNESNSFWDTETSGRATSNGGTGKTTEEMMDIATFSDTETEGLDEPWDITAVDPGETNPACIWNIVDTVTYPFLSWESVV